MRLVGLHPAVREGLSRLHAQLVPAPLWFRGPDGISWGPLLFLLLPVFCGCDSGVPTEDLGTMVFEVPEVPGADEPYEMPELGPPLEPEPEPFGSP